MAYTTINKSSDFFNTKLYTGNGSTNAITGVGHQPDWVWIKKRNGATNHMVIDAVRGVTKTLVINTTVAEDTDAYSLTAFGADGFTVSSTGAVNGNNDTFASWNWKANGTGSANTDGSINSTVSVNTTAGFSIVKWTGNATTNQTVGHGLGAVPKVMITKNTNNASQPWKSYFSEVGNNKYLVLNDSAAEATSGFLYNTTPTNSVFTISNDTGINGSGNNIIAYCFAEKTGYSKFGSWIGNNNANGSFIYTGFKPAFVMWKHTTAGYGWYMLDSKRDPDNVAEKYIYANLSDAEGTNPFFDLLSNGFKVREPGSGSNAAGAKYVYMAFAEAPLVGSNNVPCTAR